MITEFTNRELELNFLNERYKLSNFEFIPIYGRRRVGKTELILQFIKDKKAIYFLATAGMKKENIKRFKEAAKPLIDLSMVRDDWEAIFEYLKDNLKGRVIVVIDEFPYLIQTEEGVSSIFQAIIDLHLKESNLFLILAGSSLSMMYKEVLAYKAPLYGRRTGQINLKPFGFKESLELLNKPFEESLKIYAICGGVPAYLNEFKEKKSLDSLILEKVLKREAILREEVLFLLRQEFREPKVYMSILSAISIGMRNLGKILNYCGFSSKTGIMPYLSTLEGLEYVKKEISLTETLKSKKGLYFLNDRFFEFWFRFVRNNYSLIEQDPKEGLKEIKKSFNSYVGVVFEEVCKEFLLRNKKRLLFFTKIGRWWYKDIEIDLVALNKQPKEIIFVECKWKDKINAEKIVKELSEKAKHVSWYNEGRKEYFALFAKSFSKKIKTWQGKRVYCFDLKDLERVLRK